MKLSLTKLQSALLVLACACWPVAHAGLFKWTDEEGETHYGDSVPPAEAKQGRTQLNEQAMPVKVYDAAKTEEELAEARRLEAIRLEEERLARQQAQHDHVLLSTYASEEDMLQARDGKLAAIESMIQLTERRIDSMKRRLVELTDEAADYERSGKEVPDVLTRQIENIRTQTVENQMFVLMKQDEQDTTRQTFDKDIARFRELRAENE